MKAITRMLAAVLLAGVLGVPSAALAAWPSETVVDQTVRKHWEATWPDQQVEYVKKTTDCEKADLEVAAPKGKTRTLKACLVKVDVYVIRGYRYFIYRDTFVYYVKRRLKSLQLGELEKAWKEGGVPAPSPEEISEMLKPLATDKLAASDVEISVQELGTPRPHGEYYRVTLVLDLKYVKDGKQETREKVFATLQSDGTEWQPVADLAF